MITKKDRESSNRVISKAMAIIKSVFRHSVATLLIAVSSHGVNVVSAAKSPPETLEAPFASDYEIEQAAPFVRLKEPIHIHGQVRTESGAEVIANAKVTVFLMTLKDSRLTIKLKREAMTNRAGKFVVAIPRVSSPAKIFINVREEGRLDISGKAAGMQIWDPTEQIKDGIALGQNEFSIVCGYPDEVRKSTSGLTIEGKFISQGENEKSP
jgi:hypothetical protein